MEVSNVGIEIVEKKNTVCESMYGNSFLFGVNLIGPLRAEAWETFWAQTIYT